MRGGEKVLQVLIVVIIFFAILTAVLAHINPGNSGAIWGVFAIFLLLILQRYCNDILNYVSDQYKKSQDEDKYCW